MISIFCSWMLWPIDTQVTLQVSNQSEFEAQFVIEELPFGYKDTLALCSGDSALVAWNREFFYGKINEHLFFSDLSQNSSFVLDHTETLIPNFQKDKYLQQLLVSTNHLIARNSRFLSPGNPPEILLKIFLEEEKNRLNELQNLKTELDSKVFEFLTYQNRARIRNFLFYVLREIKSVPPLDTLYDQILLENESLFLHTLPNPVFYTQEVKWSRSSNALSPLGLYQYLQKDQFLTALWIKDILDFPQSWAFLMTNTTQISEIIEADESNPFKYFYENQINAFKILEKGNPFPSIPFLNSNKEIVEIQKFKGNFILLDFWAVWCAPCLQLRSEIEKILPLEGLYLISVNLDKNLITWLDFIVKNPSANGFDWHLEQGFSSEIAQQLGLAFIPRLMLIDNNGKILDSNFQFSKDKDFRQQLIELMK